MSPEGRNQAKFITLSSGHDVVITHFKTLWSIG